MQIANGSLNEYEKVWKDPVEMEATNHTVFSGIMETGGNCCSSFSSSSSSSRRRRRRRRRRGGGGGGGAGGGGGGGAERVKPRKNTIFTNGKASAD